MFMGTCAINAAPRGRHGGAGPVLFQSIRSASGKRAIPSPGKNRLARGVSKAATETVTYKNPGVAKVVYLAVTLAKGSRDATYRVAVTTR